MQADQPLHAFIPGRLQSVRRQQTLGGMKGGEASTRGRLAEETLPRQ
jgi:hypothetical protein